MPLAALTICFPTYFLDTDSRMRFSTRITAIVGIGICIIVWILSYPRVRMCLQEIWRKPKRRLIVFGDSWSDNGEYLIDPPHSDMLPQRDPARGKVWTEYLCAELSCDSHDNFARSMPDGYRGAIIDNNFLNRTALSSELETLKSFPDFRMQVKHWLEYEEKKAFSRSNVISVGATEKEEIIVAVWFSLWDLWYYADTNNDQGVDAINKSIDTIFDQLDILAEHYWPSVFSVIIPNAIDPTFLPGWQTTKTSPTGTDVNAYKQRDAVFLVDVWNKALISSAGRWDGGEVYFYDINDWMLEQIRETQMFVGNMADSNGVGSKPPPWEDVTSACVKQGEVLETVNGLERCAIPEKYLFWLVMVPQFLPFARAWVWSLWTGTPTPCSGTRLTISASIIGTT